VFGLVGANITYIGGPRLYLTYCEAAFFEHHVTDLQLLLAR
jgi:hypothetical protein